MSTEVLISGGAGFIGSHLADELLMHGYNVRVLDNLLPQVHGDDCQRPNYLNPNVTLIKGDIGDPAVVRHACRGVDIVFHFAARVGVGQSMYEIAQYTDANNRGTAVLLEELTKRPIQRLVVASSMSIYGEGLYQRRDGTLYAGVERSVDQLRAGKWELYDQDGQPLTPLPTPETKQPDLASVYALSKYDQERLCLIVGRAYDIPTVALRFFNVYGTRQALANPYTGVLAIFATRLLNNHPPLIYEDGGQRRDFVNVLDVVQACRLAIQTPGVAGSIFNIGSGHCYTVREIAERLAETLAKPHIQPQITGKYRVGDIRHCFADISRARQLLGYTPSVSLDEGLTHYAAWLRDQVALDHVDSANRELSMRGLTV
jgi:dTDP-L-rhamnose 4-epimerase